MPSYGLIINGFAFLVGAPLAFWGFVLWHAAGWTQTRVNGLVLNVEKDHREMLCSVF
jgi:hypothetical protein